MDAKPQKRKPTPREVQKLQESFPRLDYLMAETILSFTEDELQELMQEHATTE